MLSGSARRFAALAASAAIAATVVACGTTKEDRPVEAPGTPASSAPAPSSAAPAPTNKNVTPGMGGNSFSPTVTARPAPTALPGNVVTGG